MRTRVKLGVAVAAGLLLAGGQAMAKEYKVGVLLPFSGVYAGLGSHIENGFKLGLEHYGADLGENSVTIVRSDTEAKPAASLAKAKKMVLQDKVDVLMGVVSSAVLGGMRDFVHNSGTPLIVANAGNDHMTGEKCSPNIIRVSFSNSQINRPVGTWLANQGVKSAYLMAPDYAAGHQMMEAFKSTFTAAGGKIVGEAYPPLKGTKDYGPYITAAKAAQPDAIYTFFAGGAAITFVKQYHDFGVKKDIPLYGAGFLTSAAYVHVQGEAADGTVAALHYVPAIDTPENKKFQDAYQAAHGKTGSEFAVAGYDAAHLIVQAIKQADGDEEAFKAALSKVQFNGPRGPLRIDPATNNVVQNIYLFKNEFKDGKVVQTILDTIPDVQDAPNGCSM
ncbi:ABC transporter substrate-binding protein [Denitrobaculum tricleocarpae]|uniref:ABC transporter substrate-binding protein n=1 Tax=Denitrobaculum tricleocarpae TaxID=2591009 RepID=A0A545TQM9_9PROT|nr:ABC transporter substrate-binding protein [Denitrobaculum tricleocarpae]TQV79535.1 ABC transporter substrate-binding protein [Denitrobaculum tricleocarpae]